MTATQVRYRRGTQAQCEAMTPAEGEIIVDLTNDTLRVGDGSRAGGFYMPNYNDILLQKQSYVTAGGTADAITLTLPIAPSSYSQGLRIPFIATATNTGATTVSVNGETPLALEMVSGSSLVALPAGTIAAGMIYEIMHNGTKYQLMSKFQSGLTSVGQSDLNTSTGTVGSASVTTSSWVNMGVLPGGQYGFGLESVQSSGTDSCIAAIGNSASSYSHRVYGRAVSTASGTFTVRERYVNASPPFDLGDGEVGGFLFVLVDNLGEVKSHYAADVPPWAYNGPTNICPDYICPITRRKFKDVEKFLTYEEILAGVAPKMKRVEITQEMKNRDMTLIPTPFPDIPAGHKVILVDPMSDKVQRFIQEQNKGNPALSEMVTGGYLEIEDKACKRCGPKGVKIAHFKAKNKK